MERLSQHLKQFLAAGAAVVILAVPARADPSELDALFAGLKTASTEVSAQIEQRIYDIWSESGSASMDLLLQRGRDALTTGDTKTAIEHFSAVIDHAPDFAEGYNGRATAFYQLGQYGPALDDIRKTLELNPRHFGAMTGLALIMEELGMEKDALEVWRRVAAIAPNSDGVQDAINRLEKQGEGQTL